MTVTFLGTGTSQGIPVIACDCEICTSPNPKDKRLRTSVMIEVNDKVFVIDSGPDFRQQMLRERVKKLDALIFTHEHRDHTAGLDEVRAFNYKNGKPTEVYATEYVQKVFRENFSYIFINSGYPGIPKLNFHTIGNAPFEIDGVKFQPVEVYHHRLPVLGFRIGDFTYITDASLINEEEKRKIKGSKILTLNALRIEEHISHFTLKKALDLIEELKPGVAYLTHVSHQLGLYDIVEKKLPVNVHLAYDGLAIRL